MNNKAETFEVTHAEIPKWFEKYWLKIDHSRITEFEWTLKITHDELTKLMKEINIFSPNLEKIYIRLEEKIQAEAKAERITVNKKTKEDEIHLKTAMETAGIKKETAEQLASAAEKAKAAWKKAAAAVTWTAAFGAANKALDWAWNNTMLEKLYNIPILWVILKWFFWFLKGIKNWFSGLFWKKEEIKWAIDWAEELIKAVNEKDIQAIESEVTTALRTYFPEKSPIIDKISWAINNPEIVDKKLLSQIAQTSNWPERAKLIWRLISQAITSPEIKENILQFEETRAITGLQKRLPIDISKKEEIKQSFRKYAKIESLQNFFLTWDLSFREWISACFESISNQWLFIFDLISKGIISISSIWFEIVSIPAKVARITIWAASWNEVIQEAIWELSLESISSSVESMSNWQRAIVLRLFQRYWLFTSMALAWLSEAVITSGRTAINWSSQTKTLENIDWIINNLSKVWVNHWIWRAEKIHLDTIQESLWQLKTIFSNPEIAKSSEAIDDIIKTLNSKIKALKIIKWGSSDVIKAAEWFADLNWSQKVILEEQLEILKNVANIKKAELDWWIDIFKKVQSMLKTSKLAWVWRVTALTCSSKADIETIKLLAQESPHLLKKLLMHGNTLVLWGLALSEINSEKWNIFSALWMLTPIIWPIMLLSEQQFLKGYSPVLSDYAEMWLWTWLLIWDTGLLVKDVSKHRSLLKWLRHSFVTRPFETFKYTGQDLMKLWQIIRSKWLNPKLVIQELKLAREFKWLLKNKKVLAGIIIALGLYSGYEYITKDPEEMLAELQKKWLMNPNWWFNITAIKENFPLLEDSHKEFMISMLTQASIEEHWDFSIDYDFGNNLVTMNSHDPYLKDKIQWELARAFNDFGIPYNMHFNIPDKPETKTV